MSAPFERPTDELRQVTRELRIESEDDCPRLHTVVVGVQRKWLVQSGESYRADRARAKTDLQTAGWHPLEPNVGFQWTPVRVEWRDLPTAPQKPKRQPKVFY